MTDSTDTFLARRPGVREDILAFALLCTPMVHRNEVLEYLNDRYGLGLKRPAKGNGFGYAFVNGVIWKKAITKVIDAHKDEFEFHSVSVRDRHWRRRRKA